MTLRLCLCTLLSRRNKVTSRFNVYIPTQKTYQSWHSSSVVAFQCIFLLFSWMHIDIYSPSYLLSKCSVSMWKATLSTKFKFKSGHLSVKKYLLFNLLGMKVSKNARQSLIIIQCANLLAKVMQEFSVRPIVHWKCNTSIEYQLNVNHNEVRLNDTRLESSASITWKVKVINLGKRKEREYMLF